MKAMENKKEPLMSAEEWYDSETKQGYCFIDMFDFAYLYSDYAVEWQQQQNKNLYSEEDVLEIFESIISEIEIRKNNIISNSNKMTTHLLEGGCIAFESCKSLIKESLNNLKINNNGK